MGDFEWAQAQFSILKASTSKLIANDALDLSVFIMDNLGLDTTAAYVGCNEYMDTPQKSLDKAPYIPVYGLRIALFPFAACMLQNCLVFFWLGIT